MHDTRNELVAGKRYILVYVYTYAGPDIRTIGVRVPVGRVKTIRGGTHDFQAPIPNIVA
jgi:hypothetical protein